MTREGAALVLAVLLAVATLVPVPVGAAGSTAATDAGAPWQVVANVDVSADGTATVTLSVNRSVGPLYLAQGRMAGFTLERGGGAVSENDRGKLVWETDRRRTIRYTVQLGRLDYGSAVLDRSILFRTTAVAPVIYWRGQPPARWVYDVDAPSGWSVAAPGTRLGPGRFAVVPQPNPTTYPREFIAVGDFEVHTRRTGGSTVRYVRLPGTSDTPSTARILDLLERTVPVLERLTGVETEFPRLVVTAPASVESGGAARDASVVVGGDSPLYDTATGQSVYVHELTHTYQEWGWTYRGVGNWLKEGMAMYFQHLVLREIGAVTPEEFRHMVRLDVTKGYSEIGDPVSSTADGSPYAKGEAVWAALDLDVRARTNGRKTIADVVARLNEQSPDSDAETAVSKAEFLAALRAVTGVEYGTFFANYVASTRFPGVLLTGRYSLSDPVEVTHGEVPKSTLRERIRTLRSTVQRLRARLDERNATVRRLRDRLDGRAATIRRLRARLDERNATVRQLRDRLANRTTTPGGSETVTAGGRTDTERHPDRGNRSQRWLVPVAAAVALVAGVGLGRRMG